MGRKREDLTGRRYGRLTVISYNEEVSKQKGRAYWNCKCDCGNEKVICGKSLTTECTTSCGCYQKERRKELNEEMWQDEEFRQMHSDKMREMWQDEEFRQTQSDRIKEQWKDEEYRQMKSDKLKEKWNDEEFRQMQSNKAKEQWQDEEYRQMRIRQAKERTGENSGNYKGGITPISDYLRHLPVVVKWMEDAKENVNYTCELIGKQCYVETHHIKPFCELVMEAHVLNGIQIKEIIADYTEEELKLLVAYITKWHQDFSNAIVLSREVHRYFHNVFMKGKGRESSVEDIEEFKQRYLNGEFKDLLGGDLND